MSGGTDIQRISATAERGPPRESEVLCMLIDTTTCIGCKACEIACVEWNDLKVEPEFGQRVLESYQTMPDMNPSYWNLIRFNEVPVGPDRRPLPPEAAAGGSAVQWLMRKDMCMHCAEPGCLVACPAEGAIVQYASGIVDFQGEYCIGCGYCMTGCPFNIPKFDPVSHRVYKCTMCSDRVANGLGPACVKACPTGCLEFGSKREMLERAGHRAGQVQAEGFPQGGVYDPPGVGGTGVIYVLHHADQPEIYGGLPRDPKIDPRLRFWRGPLKVLGGVAMGLSLLVAAVHYLRVGRRRLPSPRPLATTAVPSSAPATGRTIVRYTFLDRAIHWTVALTFVYLALTGLGLFSPKLSWLLSVLGGGQTARAWHPIVGCVFTGALLALFLKWMRDLRLTREDRRWLLQVRDYMAGRDDRILPSGRFNAGQKVLFWVQVLLGIVLLASGIPIWLPEEFSRAVRLWCAVVHSASAVLAILSIIVHIYMAIFVTQGAFRAMIEGKVTEEWARHHHGLWAEKELGPESPEKRAG